MTGTPVWVLESAMFEDRHRALRDAAAAEGHRAIEWDDRWWRDGRAPTIDGPAIFHGSLGNAARVRHELPWEPGAYCDVDAFRCSAWFPRARPWSLQRTWVETSVRALTAAPAVVLAPLPASDEVFVRPDSPLKPFGGRVVRRSRLSPAALDHGYYYDDLDLPIVVAPVRKVSREWRFVVVDRRVVAGSGYDGPSRRAVASQAQDAVWEFAAEVARQLEPPEPVYVMDVGEADGALHVVELNPFSGADLYACDRTSIVRAVAAHLSGAR
ncbi:MAG: ATP-grasp domain-containing protein [Planctomycetia bacterium]|nr:ATP-grasp domain-containing protein [Planctomycetia bacterium]